MIEQRQQSKFFSEEPNYYHPLKILSWRVLTFITACTCFCSHLEVSSNLSACAHPLLKISGAIFVVAHLNSFQWFSMGLRAGLIAGYINCWLSALFSVTAYRPKIFTPNIVFYFNCHL